MNTFNKLKEIVINARFLTQTVTGVQRFAIEISKQLKKINPSIKFIAPYNIIHKETADELDAELIGKMKGHLWEQIDLPYYLVRNNNPLLLNLANTAPLTYQNKISTIQDLSFKHNPEWFSRLFAISYGFMVPKIINSSVHIFTDSNYVKNDINSYFKISSDKITYGYGAVADIFNSTADNNILNHKGKYILAVGSLDPRKNLAGLIEAFNSIKTDAMLIIVGGKNNNFAKLNSDNITEKIKFTGYVDDEELYSLYKGAKVFVYPSFYEGFGIPPLEAQSCGCPVIVSNVTSLPEVCGESAIYCDPFDINDITKKIQMVLSNSKLQNDLKKKGLVNVKRFSWEKTALKFYEVIKNISE